MGSFDERGGFMKRRAFTLIFILVSIFMLSAANDGISGAHEITVTLRVPNLPTGG